MSLTRQDVEKIAHLARLSITEAELPVYVSALSSIVNFVDELSKVQTGDVAPLAHPLDCGKMWSRTATDTRNTRPMRPRWLPGYTSCRELSNNDLRPPTLG
jgi:aspartyl/glutamyl-tRNA(Asn/Gln) amidotransferase C subunit